MIRRYEYCGIVANTKDVVDGSQRVRLINYLSENHSELFIDSYIRRCIEHHIDYKKKAEKKKKKAE